MSRAKAQASVEMIAYVSIFLLIFVAGASIYLANIQKITQNTANEYSQVILNSFANGFMLAKMTPGTQILVEIEPELPGNFGYKLELKTNPEGIVVNLITMENGFVFQRVLYSDGIAVELLDEAGLPATELALEPAKTRAVNMSSSGSGGTAHITVRGMSR